MESVNESATSSGPLVPRWLLAALAAAALGEFALVAMQRERWAVDELPAPRTNERRPRREFEVPPGASAEEELAILRSELAAIERRERQREEVERGFERLEAQLNAGSHPGQDRSVLEQRRRKHAETLERDGARRPQIQARIDELAGRAAAPSQP